MKETRLEKRVNKLDRTMARLLADDGLLKGIENSATAYAMVNHVNFRALYLMVAELAEREGLTAEQFKKNFVLRQRYWHDAILTKVEEEIPSLAAAIDARTIEQCDVEGGYPSLFTETDSDE